jgi:hypothetical protein
VNVAHINGVLSGFGKHQACVDANRVKRLRRIDQVNGLRQRLHCEDVDALDDSSFPGVRLRDGNSLQAHVPSSNRRGKRTSDGAHAAVQRKLAQEHALVERLAEKMTHAASQTQRHRQIERRAFFTNIGGSEVDRNALAMRKLERTVSQCGFDALAAFLHGVVGKTHHIEVLHARGAYVYFHFHNIGVNSIH